MSREYKTELEWASADELIKELIGRFDHAVFCGTKNPVDDHVEIVRRWQGNSHTCAGLAYDAAHVILHDFHDRMSRDDDDDESDVVPDEDEL